MDAILVVSGDLGERERLKSSLQARGWWVVAVGDRQSALRAAADQAPRAVILDAELDDAPELVKTFGSSNGGPGALVLSPETSSPESLGFLEQGADELLRRSVSAGDLAEAVSRLSAQPRTQPLRRVQNPGRTLSSDEIFGDLLAEMNGDGGQEEDEPSRPELVQAWSRDEAAGEDVSPGAELVPAFEAEELPAAAEPGARALEAGGESLDQLFAEPESVAPEPEVLEWPDLEAAAPPEPKRVEPLEPAPEPPTPPEPVLPDRAEAVEPPAVPLQASRRRWLLPAGLAAVLLAGAGLALFFWPATAVSPPETAAAPAQAPKLEATPAPVEESAGGLGQVDLESLIDRELERREAALREAFLEEERRLLRELDRLKKGEVSTEPPSRSDSP